MFSSLLGTQEDLKLTLDESKELVAFQRSLVILGPAGGSVMICPGNQIGVRPEDQCPYAAKCPLLRMQKAPASRMCPIERKIIEERFSAWAAEMGQDPLNLPESHRATISQLTYIDLQEQRS